MNRHLLFFIAACLLGAASLAAQPNPTCDSQARDKKLAGAALKSFMTKCENDARATCMKAAAEKKLAGAAKSSFEKKCIADATGH
jgi:hypothetical protein